MKNYFQVFTLCLLFSALVSCNQETILGNRLENTEWQLTQKIRTISSLAPSEFEPPLLSAQFENYAVDRTETIPGFTVSFHENGTGTLMKDGVVDGFAWESSVVDENLQVNIRTNEEKRFTVLIGDRDLQLWEAQTRETFSSSIRTTIEKWELKLQ